MQTAELFGWKRGAFTGAVASHDGYVARAAGGTLFIDEVDKLSLAAQASLLQLLETRRFRVLGDDRGEQGANVRFVVGTNADLAEAVRRGAFREDLYYRINVLAVRLPGLDDRKDELVPWAEHMLRRRADEGAGSVDVLLAGDAASALLERSWPGNLRQLDNVVRRAFVLALADESGPGPRRVTRSHVAASLAAEAGPSSAEAGGGGGIIDALREVAALYVRDARRRHDAGCPVDLDEVLVLRALVLAEALRAADGDAAVAFGWLGRSGLVRSRNHHKTLERERDRLRSFATELGEPLPGELLARLVPR